MKLLSSNNKKYYYYSNQCAVFMLFIIHVSSYNLVETGKMNENGKIDLIRNKRSISNSMLRINDFEIPIKNESISKNDVIDILINNIEKLNKSVIVIENTISNHNEENITMNKLLLSKRDEILKIEKKANSLEMQISDNNYHIQLIFLIFLGVIIMILFGFLISKIKRRNKTEIMSSRTELVFVTRDSKDRERNFENNLFYQTNMNEEQV